MAENTDTFPFTLETLRRLMLFFTASDKTSDIFQQQDRKTGLAGKHPV
jgi:hypothetical protein